MSADIIILPVTRALKMTTEQADRRARDRAALVAKVRIGPHSSVRVCAYTASEMGIPLVEMRGTSGEIDNLTTEQAEAIATALLDAVAKAKS